MAAGWQARLPLFEIACVLARFDHIASSIVSANHSVTSQRSIPVKGAFSHPSALFFLTEVNFLETIRGAKRVGPQFVFCLHTGTAPFRQTAARLVVFEDAQLANRPHTRRSGLARLFPIKHENALGPALTHQALGHRQGLEICRKLDLPGARNFAFPLVCDFQTALVHAAA
jgi:hypothetical protein